VLLDCALETELFWQDLKKKESLWNLPAKCFRRFTQDFLLPAVTT
jgi:hypothetical protein